MRSTAEELMELNKSHITFSSVMFPAGSSRVHNTLMSLAFPSCLCLSPSRCWHTLVPTLMVSCLFRDVNCGLPYRGDTHTAMSVTTEHRENSYSLKTTSLEWCMMLRFGRSRGDPAETESFPPAGFLLSWSRCFFKCSTYRVRAQNIRNK